MKVVIIIAAVITVLAWAPAVSVFLAYAVASATGCRVDEGSVHPCVVGGVDIGGLLYSLGLMGWLFIATLPVAALSVLFWLAMGVYAIVRNVRGG